MGFSHTLERVYVCVDVCVFVSPCSGPGGLISGYLVSFHPAPGDAHVFQAFSLDYNSCLVQARLATENRPAARWSRFNNVMSGSSLRDRHDRESLVYGRAGFHKNDSVCVWCASKRMRGKEGVQGRGLSLLWIVS